jgi:AcrR family transcriptional regulator
MSGSKREAQRKRTHERLYESALEVFRRVGVTAARIEEIAAQAGVSRASFYFHFPTKEHVLAEMWDASAEALVTAVDELPADATLPEVFDTVGAVLTARWSDEPKLFGEIAMLTLRRLTEQGDERQGFRRALTDRFVSAAEGGVLTPETPPGILADLYLAQLFVVSRAWASSPEGDLPAQLRSAGALFLHGAAAR